MSVTVITGHKIRVDTELKFALYFASTRGISVTFSRCDYNRSVRTLRELRGSKMEVKIWLLICTEIRAEYGHFLHRIMTSLQLSRSLNERIFALLEAGHFQVTKGGPIQRANQQTAPLLYFDHRSSPALKLAASSASSSSVDSWSLPAMTVLFSALRRDAISTAAAFWKLIPKPSQ